MNLILGLRRVANGLTTRLTLWLALAAVVGLVLPGAAARLRPATPVILAIMIAGLGVGVAPRDLRAALRRPGAVALGLAAQLAVTPVVGAVLWKVAGPGPVAAGVVVQAVAPSEITSPLMVRLAGGRVAAALPVMVTSLLLAPVTVPLLVAAIVGAETAVSSGAMLRSLLLTVVVPLLAGSLLAGRTRAPRLLREVGAGVSAAMVVLLVAAVAGGAVTSAAMTLPAVAGAAGGAAVLLVAGFAAGAAAGRFAPAHRRVLLFTTGMREFGVATAVSLEFLGARAAVAPAVYGMAMMVGAAWLAGRLAGGGASPAQP